MTALEKLLDTFRHAAVTEREKGTYFEELTACYLRNEATYRDLYSDVWTYADWADLQDLDKRDTGIDVVAKMRCPNFTVQTDRNYTDSCGKNGTRHKAESIFTTTD